MHVSQMAMYAVIYDCPAGSLPAHALLLLLHVTCQVSMAWFLHQPRLMRLHVV
jgi:hypothetical protein